MIIKSHIRGGYRSAAEYMKDQGKNEKTRLVEISDPEAKTLDEAFRKMWEVAGCTHCKKPLHHISINPMKDERLTDKQVMAIVERCEEKYGYKMFHHQRVIVEHIKDGRQHFHVIWNRVSLMTGRAVWPGEHWNKSKQICREMERELGLKRPTPKRTMRPRNSGKGSTRVRTAKKYPKSIKYGAKKSKHYKNTYSKFANKNWFANSRTNAFGKPSHFKTSIRFKSDGGMHRMASRYDALRPITPTAFNPILIKSIYVKPIKEALQQSPAPQAPTRSSTGWPPAAVLDWKVWGHRNPRRFFALWPELSI